MESHPEYIALRDKANKITNKCSQDLKKIIIQAAKLELSAINTDTQQHLIKSLRLITQSLMIIDNDTTNCDNKTYQFIKHYLPLLTTNTPMDETAFCELYKKVHSIDTYPPNQHTTTDHATDHADSIILTQLTQVRGNLTTTPPPEELLPLKNIVDAIFVTSWQRYCDQQQKNKVTLELQKLTTAYLTKQATELAVLDVDSKPPANKTELKALIRQETKAETQEIAKKTGPAVQTTTLPGTDKKLSHEWPRRHLAPKEYAIPTNNNIQHN
jgi:hypothetical protein